MKSSRRTIFNHTIGFLLGCILLMSCYEREEGCLDSNSTNFDVYADDNCCCSYPILVVNVIKEVDGTRYAVADTFTNVLGQRYQILEQSFYMSNVVLTYADGSTSEVRDTLLRDIPLGSDNEVTIEDNFGLVRQSTPAYIAGTIAENGDITSMTFQVGLTDEIDMLVPAQLPITHALGENNAADHYIEDQGYIFVRWVISVIEPTGIETIEIDLSGSPNLQDITNVADETEAPGVITNLEFVIDYGKWLEGIDFAADIIVIESQIASNTASAFSLQ